MACEHRGCKCDDAQLKEQGKQFCSDFCRKAQTTGRHEDQCKCGHAKCAGSQG